MLTSLRLIRIRSKKTRITPMRRILSFHGFLLVLDFSGISLRLTARDCLKRKENPYKSMRQWRTRIHYAKSKSVKEQIRCIRAIRDFFECMCS